MMGRRQEPRDAQFSSVNLHKLGRARALGDATRENPAATCTTSRIRCEFVVGIKGATNSKLATRPYKYERDAGVATIAGNNFEAVRGLTAAFPERNERMRLISRVKSSGDDLCRGTSALLCSGRNVEIVIINWRGVAFQAYQKAFRRLNDANRARGRQNTDRNCERMSGRPPSFSGTLRCTLTHFTVFRCSLSNYVFYSASYFGDCFDSICVRKPIN